MRSPRTNTSCSTTADFDKVKLESTQTIDIDQFVDADEIDRLYWDDPFYVVPDKGVGAEAFGVIREAMAKQDKIALGLAGAAGNRERRIALEPRGKGLVAYTLRTDDEVRDADDYFDDIPTRKADADMVDIAARIIDQKDAAFDPTQFKDRYDEALKALIEAKQKGQGVVEVARARRHQRHRPDGRAEEQPEGLGERRGDEEAGGEEGGCEKEEGGVIFLLPLREKVAERSEVG